MEFVTADVHESAKGFRYNCCTPILRRNLAWNSENSQKEKEQVDAKLVLDEGRV